MMRFERMLVRSDGARRRCLVGDLRVPILLDDAAMLQVVDGFGIGRVSQKAALADYIYGMRHNACSCFQERPPVTTLGGRELSRYLNEAASSLARLGGPAGLVGLVFAAETLNMDDALAGADRSSLARSLTHLVDAVAYDEMQDRLIDAAAHHCYDLIAALNRDDRAIPARHDITRAGGAASYRRSLR